MHPLIVNPAAIALQRKGCSNERAGLLEAGRPGPGLPLEEVDESHFIYLWLPTGHHCSVGHQYHCKNDDGVMQVRTEPLGLSAFRWRPRTVGVFQAFGVSGPESLLDLLIGGFEFPSAFVRAEIMGAFLVAGGERGVARIERFSTDGIYGGLRYGGR